MLCALCDFVCDMYAPASCARVYTMALFYIPYLEYVFDEWSVIYIYIYIYIHIYVCTCIYIYIYMHRNGGDA